MNIWFGVVEDFAGVEYICSLIQFGHVQSIAQLISFLVWGTQGFGDGRHWTGLVPLQKGWLWNLCLYLGWNS